jgi:hypothetical protein
MYTWNIYTCHKLLIVLKISFILAIYWDKKPLLCYFTIWTQQLKNLIFSLKASWRYLCRWTLILSNIGLPYTWYSFLTRYWSRNINKAKKRLEKQVYIALRCNTTKHGYQSKRMYGKVVRKHKIDSYIVG